jgi:hypothetical protein
MEIEPGQMMGQKTDSALEKSKSKRKWFGKKKNGNKEKEKEKDKDKDKDPVKNAERIDNVARLMEEAMFGFGGGSVRKASKVKSEISLQPQPQQQQQQQDEAHTQYQDEGKAELEDSDIEQSSTIQVSGPMTVVAKEGTPMDVDQVQGGSEGQPREHEGSVPEELESSNTSTSGANGDLNGVPTSPEIKPVSSDGVKSSKSRHFSIFRKKNKENKESKDLKENDTELQAVTENKDDMEEDEAEPQEGGSALSRSVTNEDSKSVQSQRTRQSSKSGDRLAADMSAALAVRLKEKKRDSGEYVPYEYQEEVEGPLMERVEVKERHEIIGFVLVSIDPPMEGG